MYRVFSLANQIPKGKATGVAAPVDDDEVSAVPADEAEAVAIDDEEEAVAAAVDHDDEAVAKAIDDDEDRQIFEQDMASLPR